jgi:uncharacterized protein YggE
MKWFFLLLVSSSLFASETKGVQVQGSCQIKVVPDRGTVSFTTENQSKDQKEAVKKTNSQMNDLKEKIQKLKLADSELKTTNYTVYPVREYEKDHYVDKGTKASMTIEVTTSEISRLGEAMVEASKVGIQNVGSMVTFLSLEKSQAEYLKCLDIASNDARKKADQLARKLGFKVGEVQSVIESPMLQQQPTPYPERAMFAKGAMMDSAPVVSIEAGTQNFSTNILVTFEIK